MGKDERRHSPARSRRSRSRSRQKVRKKHPTAKRDSLTVSPRLTQQLCLEEKAKHVGGLSFECEEFTGGEEWCKPRGPKHDQTDSTSAKSCKRSKHVPRAQSILGGLVDVDEEANQGPPANTVGVVPVLGSYGTQGKRPYQEDRAVTLQPLQLPGMAPLEGLCFVAVYDGHGGSAAAEYCERYLHGHLRDLPFKDVVGMERAMVEAFRATEEGFLNHALKTQLQDGAVAVCALLAGETLVVGNVGDSRCVLSREGVAHRLSVDHKPDYAEEKQRVMDHGGNVVFSGCWRVSHPVLPVRLACSRSIGDRRFKDLQVVSALPHVRSVLLSNTDHFLILASDGIWDVLSDQVAVDLVAKAIALYQLEHTGMPPHARAKGAVVAAARYLVDEACRVGSDDNCTVVVVDLRWD